MGRHTSKLSTFVIDCQVDDLDAATRFWAAALRRDAKPPEPGDSRYRDLRCAPAEPLVMIQKVEHPSRIHLDIESSDIEAEVARLKTLGATEVERVRTWVVMEAPTGQRFCVVRQQRPQQIAPAFDGDAALLALAGHYQGKVRTFLDAPVDSDDTLYVEPMLGGRWLRLQWFGAIDDKPRSGEMLLGRAGDSYEMTWADTFHTSPAILFSRGQARSDGVIAVTGSYSAGAETWQWRTEWHLAPLRMRAFNIAPDRREWLAIEVDWQRLG